MNEIKNMFLNHVKIVIRPYSTLITQIHSNNYSALLKKFYKYKFSSSGIKSICRKDIIITIITMELYRY